METAHGQGFTQREPQEIKQDQAALTYRNARC